MAGWSAQAGARANVAHPGLCWGGLAGIGLSKGWRLDDEAAAFAGPRARPKDMTRPDHIAGDTEAVERRGERFPHHWRIEKGGLEMGSARHESQLSTPGNALPQKDFLK